jgi:hypothetical protein
VQVLCAVRSCRAVRGKEGGQRDQGDDTGDHELDQCHSALCASGAQHDG